MSPPRSRRVTVEQLTAFTRMLQFGNVTQAAESLQLSQSTVTHHLKSLQSGLGLTLFEPVGRTLRPTAAGLEIGAGARSTLRSLAELLEKAESLSSAVTGSVTVGASQTTVSHHLPVALAEFLSPRPGVNVQIVPGNTAGICTQVATRELDIGLIEGPSTDRRLIELRLVQDLVVVVVSTRHPLASRSRVTRRDLSVTRYLAREPGSGTELIAEAMLGDAYRAAPRMQIGQMDAVRAAVRAGLGFAVLPRLAVKDDLELGLLRLLPIHPHSRWIRGIRRPGPGGAASEALWAHLRDRIWQAP